MVFLGYLVTAQPTVGNHFCDSSTMEEFISKYLMSSGTVIWVTTKPPWSGQCMLHKYTIHIKIFNRPQSKLIITYYIRSKPHHITRRLALKLNEGKDDYNKPQICSVKFSHWRWFSLVCKWYSSPLLNSEKRSLTS